MMFFAQANAVNPTWLQQMWIFGVVIAGLIVGPMTAVWISGRRQKREVVQGEEFVTKTTCQPSQADLQVENGKVKVDVTQVRTRIDTVETTINRSIRELRQEIMTELGGLRGEVTMLVRAVGQLQGQIELDRRRDERS